MKGSKHPVIFKEIGDVKVTSSVDLSWNAPGTNVYCAALDLSKAYDRTNHDVIIRKLIDSEIPMSIVKIFQFMFRNTDVCVRFNGVNGEFFRVKNGLRQGGCSSSLLFAYYVNEVIEKIKSLDIGCILKGMKINIVAFADDILLMCPSKVGLQILIDEISRIFDKLYLRFNTDKSKYIVFRHKSNLRSFGSININNAQLEKVSSLKYLGIFLSEDFSIKGDVDRALKSFLKQFNAMFQKFNFLNSEVLSFLFKTYTTSFYGINLWFEHKIQPSHIRNLEVAYHKAIKKIVGIEVWRSNHEACDLMGIDLFKHFLSKRMAKFYFSAISSECKMFRMLRYHFMFSSQLYKILKERFNAYYQIENVIGNDKDALIARISFVQMREPRSNYVYEPG